MLGQLFGVWDKNIWKDYCNLLEEENNDLCTCLYYLSRISNDIEGVEYYTRVGCGGIQEILRL